MFLDIPPSSCRICRQQIIELLEPCLDPGSLNFVERRSRRAPNVLDLLIQLDQAPLADRDFFAQSRGGFPLTTNSTKFESSLSMRRRSASKLWRC